MAQFFGRLHPLFVHLPIGILFVAFIFEVLSAFPKFKKLRSAIQPSLLVASIFAIASAVSGYLLSQEGGYDDALLALHRSAGIATAVFSTLLFFLRSQARVHFQNRRTRKMARLFLFVLLMALVSFTGHIGGSLTHGEGFLTDFGMETESVSPLFNFKSVAAVDSSLFFPEVVEPILRARCYSCHSSTKQKGQLRLDKPDLMMKGGKHGIVLKSGIADSSLLYRRLMLPLEDEHHMPPNEKAQPASAELALLKSWIADGGHFDKRVSAYDDHARIKIYLSTLFSPPAPTLVPQEPVTEAPAAAIEALTSQGILVIPVALNSHYLSVSFVNARSADDEVLALLLPLVEQLVWLDAGRTKITNAGMRTVGELRNLTQLNLNYTDVEDQALEPIGQLERLTSLNLVGTKVGDKGLSYLTSLKNLKRLFLYQTLTTREGTLALRATAPSLMIDTGSYRLILSGMDSLDHRSEE